MLMSKIPRSEYALSSTLVVSRAAAHERRWATLNSLRGSMRNSASWLIPVIPVIRHARLDLDPMGVQVMERKTTCRGAMSSWSVHPRVNHRLRRNSESLAS